MKKQIISITLVITGFILGATALSSLAAWTAPSVPDPTTTPPESLPCTPPKCNIAAPINTSSSSQIKLGALTINAGSLIDNIGLTVVGKIKLDDVRRGAGKVLTDVNGDGVGTWQTPSTSNIPVPGIKCPVNGDFANDGNGGSYLFDFAWRCIGGYVKHITNHAGHNPYPALTANNNGTNCVTTSWYLSGYNGNIGFGCNATTKYLEKVCLGGTSCLIPGTYNLSNNDHVYCNWEGSVLITGTTESTIFDCFKNKLTYISQTATATTRPYPLP